MGEYWSSSVSKDSLSSGYSIEGCSSSSFISRGSSFLFNPFRGDIADWWMSLVVPWSRSSCLYKVIDVAMISSTRSLTNIEGSFSPWSRREGILSSREEWFSSLREKGSVVGHLHFAVSVSSATISFWFLTGWSWSRFSSSPKQAVISWVSFIILLSSFALFIFSSVSFSILFSAISGIVESWTWSSSGVSAFERSCIAASSFSSSSLSGSISVSEYEDSSCPDDASSPNSSSPSTFFSISCW